MSDQGCCVCSEVVNNKSVLFIKRERAQKIFLDFTFLNYNIDPHLVQITSLSSSFFRPFLFSPSFLSSHSCLSSSLFQFSPSSS